MKILFVCLVFYLAFIGCKERYVPKIQSTAAGNLVVEGFINSGGEPSVFTITRSTKLYDTAQIIYEQNAMVHIEGKNQESYSLAQTGNGTYTSDTLHLDPNEQYRVHIVTQDGREYASDFQPVKYTPPIDSISWVRNNDGVTLYLNTHDLQTNPGYYRWDYTETWEIHSKFTTSLYYVLDPVTNKKLEVAFRYPNRQDDTTIYKCWRNHISTEINLGSSEKLTSDIIHLPILQIPNDDEKIGVLYSINVKLFALSKDAYNFYQTLKVNTEQLGSIFDPLPTSLPSNIHCLSDPSETAVGYVSVAEERDERIFISNADVPGWSYVLGCKLITIENNADSIEKKGGGTTPTEPAAFEGQWISLFYASPSVCVDCTIKGTNVRPPFWP